MQSIILPRDRKIMDSENDVQVKIAILLNLYYPEMVKMFYDYIRQIPDYIDVYVKSSNDEVFNILNSLQEHSDNSRSIICRKKINRGRDISAFLVENDELIDKYDFLCFLHDKRAKNDVEKDDVAFWIFNLIENSIGSTIYINNLISTMIAEPRIGLIIPPEPIFKSFTKGTWGRRNLSLAEAVLKRIGIEKDICTTLSPSLGTVFWCRTKALAPLLCYEWKYDDFDDEPMPDDGTISHAIERILPQIADYCGYQTCIVCNDQYCIREIERMKEDVFRFISKNNDNGLDHLERWLDVQNLTIKAFLDFKRVYLFGAGEYGRKRLAQIRSLGFEPSGFVVSDLKGNDDIVDGLHIFKIEMIDDIDDVMILVTVGILFRDEIVEYLKENRIKNFVVI